LKKKNRWKKISLAWIYVLCSLYLSFTEVRHEIAWTPIVIPLFENLEGSSYGSTRFVIQQCSGNVYVTDVAANTKSQHWKVVACCLVSYVNETNAGSV
jgi:hypothetical protein